MKRFIAPLLLSLALVSCGDPKENEDNKTVFRYNEPGGITSLDPAFSRNLENIWAVNQIFNGLVQMSTTLEVEPCIAKSWEVSEDGLQYTFNLRNDVYFQDHEKFQGGKGRVVTAHDFVYSFYRIIDEKIASPGAYIFNYLDKSEESNYIGFRAIDDYTFKIYLSQPYPPFLGLLTMQYCSVVPKEIVEYFGNDFRRNPVGTGPFIMKTWKEGEKLILAKNNNYFETDGGNKLPYLDAVAISFVKDPQVAFLDFARGNFDFKSGIDHVFKDEVLTHDGELQEEYKGKFTMEKQPWLETIYMGILIDPAKEHVKTSPLRLKAIRQAMNYGIDKEKLVRYLRNNIGNPAHSGFVPMGMPSFSEDLVKGYKYDPEKAKELLYVAGYPEGKGMPAISITTTSHYEDLCEFIQHELSEIGIKIDVEVIDEAAYREMIAQSRVNVFTKSWVADYPDAENFLGLFYGNNFCPKGPNYTHFSSPNFDILYEKSLMEVNDSIRFDLYRQMDNLVMEEAPIIPLFYNDVVRFVHNNIEGLESNPMNILSLKKVKVKK